MGFRPLISSVNCRCAHGSNLVRRNKIAATHILHPFRHSAKPTQLQNRCPTEARVATEAGCPIFGAASPRLRWAFAKRTAPLSPPQPLQDNGRAPVYGCQKKTRREAITALPKAGVKPEGRNDLYIVVAVACFTLTTTQTSKTPANSHVKPQNTILTHSEYHQVKQTKQLTPTKISPAKWHFSYAPSHKIEIEIKTSPAKSRAEAFKPGKPPITPKESIFWTQAY